MVKGRLADSHAITNSPHAHLGFGEVIVIILLKLRQGFG
jgi:hypothetical protein